MADSEDLPAAVPRPSRDTQRNGQPEAKAANRWLSWRMPGRHLLRRLYLIAAMAAIILYFSAGAAVLALRYAVLPQLDRFKPRIEGFASHMLGAQVIIGQLSAQWRTLQPSFTLTDLTIRDAHGEMALRVPRATAVVSWRSLITLRPTLSSLVIDQPEVLAQRDAQGRLTVAGVSLAPKRGNHYHFTRWLLTQNAIVLRQGALRWRDATAPTGMPTELRFTAIRMALLNDGHLHQFGIQATPDRRTASSLLLNGPLDLRARFSHGLLTHPDWPRNWEGNAYLSIASVNLATLSRFLTLPIDVPCGWLAGRHWLSFANGRLTRASGELRGDTLTLRIPAKQASGKATLQSSNAPIEMGYVALKYEMRRTKRTLWWSLRDVSLELGGESPIEGWPVARVLNTGRFDGRYRTAHNGQGESLSLSGDVADLELCAKLARSLPLSITLADRLARFEPRGIVRHYRTRFVWAAPKRTSAAGQPTPVTHYQIAGQFEGASVAAQPAPPAHASADSPSIGLPGFENLSGTINANESRGTLTIHAQQAAITVNGLFDQPKLRFDRLSSQASWTVIYRHGRRKIAVALPELRFSNSDMAGRVQATYRYPAKIGSSTGWLDLAANLERVAVPRVPRYLPTHINGKLRAYLAHALQAGTANHATVRVRGNLADFPFARPQSGEFQIIAPFEGGRFDPSPYPFTRTAGGQPSRWPPIDALTGTFELHRNLLRFDLAQGRYRNVTLTRLSGRISDLSDHREDLRIDGDARGPLNDMLRYLNASPIASQTGHLTELLSAQGNAALSVTLAVSRRGPPRVSAVGSLKFANNRLTYRSLPPLTQLGGKLEFTDQSLTINRLTGQWLGASIRGGGGVQADGSVAVTLAGRIDLDAARAQFQDKDSLLVSSLQQLSGRAPYFASIRAAPHQRPEIIVHSKLTGLAIHLPAPLAKPAAAALPLHLVLRPHAGENGADRLDLRLGPLVGSYLLQQTHDNSGDSYRVIRGAWGINHPAKLPAHGVTATVTLEQLDLDAWRATVDRIASAAATPDSRRRDLVNAKAWLPTQITAQLAMLTLFDRHWENVVLHASDDGSQWQANLVSAQAAGHLLWRPQKNSADADGARARGKLQAHFARLAVPVALNQNSQDDSTGEQPESRSDNFPEVDFTANEFIFHQRNFGRLKVIAHPMLNGDDVPVWQLDKLEIDNPAAKLTAYGNWRASQRRLAHGDPTHRTALRFRLEIANAGTLLERLNLPRTLQDGSGTLIGKINWRGGPTAIDYPTLNGQLALNLKHGQILKANPGLAKLLGVLSLQGLVHFLTFDFKGVLGQGLPFDQIKATSTISNGMVSTNDFMITSMIAHVTMAGVINLINEQQNLHVVVTPTLNASSAALAVAAVNPLLGIGALFAQLALSESISKAFAHQYTITGAWAAPHIRRIDADRGKVQHR